MPSLNLVNDHLDLANMVYSYINLRLLMSLCVDIHSQLFVLLGSSVQASTSIIHHLIPSAQTLSHDLHRVVDDLCAPYLWTIFGLLTSFILVLHIQLCYCLVPIIIEN